MVVDTLTIARELKAADLPAGQAEAIAAAIGRSIAESSATKSDVDNARLALRGDIEAFKVEFSGKLNQLESKLDARIEGLRSTLITWFVGTALTLAAVIIAAIKL